MEAPNSFVFDLNHASYHFWNLTRSLPLLHPLGKRARRDR